MVKKNKIPILNDKQRTSRIAVKQSDFDKILLKASKITNSDLKKKKDKK
jgi:hypothetical protein